MSVADAGGEGYDPAGGTAVPVELSPQQQAAVDRADGEPVAVSDPRSAAPFVLLSAGRYESLRQAWEEDRVQAALRASAFRNAVGRAEDSP